MKIAGKLIGWLVILIIGLYLISYLTRYSSLAGSGEGTGVFSHGFRAQFQIGPDFNAHDLTSGTITVEATHPATFMLSGHVSPNYRSARIDWFLYREHQNIGEATVDLENMLVAREGNATRLNPESISRLFGITNPTDQDKLLADAFVKFLQAARDGNLPRPNHHGHSMSEPLPGHMQHFATGFSLRPLELAWTVGWIACGMMMLFRAKIKKPNRVPGSD